MAFQLGLNSIYPCRGIIKLYYSIYIHACLVRTSLTRLNGDTLLTQLGLPLVKALQERERRLQALKLEHGAFSVW